MFTPAIAMLGIGVGAAFILAVAAKVFHVEVDPRIIDVEDALPGANCGGCGYTGCGACAEAIVQGKASVNACIAGGPEVASQVARVMGGEVGFIEPRIAHHYCTGGDRAEKKYHYEGALDCRAMAEHHGGELLCKHGCFGLGTCVRSCPFDALRMGPEGYPEVVPNKCVGCGTCERVCPTHVIHLYSLSDRLLHFNNKNECLAPCKQLCPAQINIPAYVELAAQGRYEEAVSVIKERNPLPLICGRVCPAPCEAGCRRVAIEDEPVHHNYIKRFVADWEMNLPNRKQESILPETGKKIAIVGGGPCGLSAAYYLRRLGHAPTIFDSKPALGGMLRYGIPEYRLPKKILDFEIQEILDLGVEVKCDMAMGKDFTLKLLEKDYDAILLAMGAWDNSSLRCDGEDLEGVWKGTEYLQKRELGIQVDLEGQRVVVVGGGNTAMDACRSALRMGAKEVILLYRRTRKEMPANAVEIVAAEHEGIQYHFLAAPTRLIGDEAGKLKQIEYIKMELGEPDKSGRRRPVPIEGSETLMDVDVVIAAIGQKPLMDWMSEGEEERGLKLTRWATIVADEETLQTSIPHIFTGGDIFSGPALLVDAIGTGRRAARSIHRFLNGEDLSFPEGTYTEAAKVPDSHKVPITGVARKPKVPQPELPVTERIKTFEEVDLTLSPELMKAEAERCMRCGTLCYFSDDERKQLQKGNRKIRAFKELLRRSP
jgi:NADPH-dependent glutamate synthase beta subunit-like oxidoreductase/Pyruvate/2-oxoacid:ferredoxin oxidoreductase delta subunit